MKVHVHEWQPPEYTMQTADHQLSPVVRGRYRPEEINMRVCACGEVGWLVPVG